MKFESLIFDIDGTLWDSRELVARGYNIHLEEMGYGHLRVDAEYLKGLFGKTMREIADIMLTEIPRQERYRLLEGCMESQDRVLKADPCRIAYDGVVETLRLLHRDYRLFIVSNSQAGYPELLIDKLGIGDLIEDHLCFGDTGTEKGPTIRTLMQRHHLDSAVYIGDTQGDLEACKEAGLPFIFCAYGFGAPESWDAKIDSFRELPAILETF